VDWRDHDLRSGPGVGRELTKPIFAIHIDGCILEVDNLIPIAAEFSSPHWNPGATLKTTFPE
jgi:hypothetical protein